MAIFLNIQSKRKDG